MRTFVSFDSLSKLLLCGYLLDVLECFFDLFVHFYEEYYVYRTGYMYILFKRCILLVYAFMF